MKWYGRLTRWLQHAAAIGHLPRLPAACLLVAGLSGSASSFTIIADHQAYVWQIRWTPPLLAAIDQAGDLFNGWRVLVGVAEPGGQAQRVAVNWKPLRASGKPVTLVVRIDGRFDLATEDRLFTDVTRLVADDIKGGNDLGVEIDYDCPTFRLPIYTAFLRRLRSGLPDSTRLSITVLPTWMGSNDLRALLSVVDESTLQVHAIDSPRQQLFDPRKAIAWVTRFSGYHRPFRVALPDYGVRVSWDQNDRPLIESERPLMASGSEARELVADPADIMRVLKSLSQAGGPYLRGVSWFRLPTAADERTWSMPTLRSVIRGEYAPERLVMTLRANSSGFQEITLSNSGRTDLPLPVHVSVPRSCSIGDGSNGYDWVIEADGSVNLRTTEGGMMRAGTMRVIGWARCTKVGGSDAT